MVANLAVVVTYIYRLIRGSDQLDRDEIPQSGFSSDSSPRVIGLKVFGKHFRSPTHILTSLQFVTESRFGESTIEYLSVPPNLSPGPSQIIEQDSSKPAGKETA